MNYSCRLFFFILIITNNTLTFFAQEPSQIFIISGFVKDISTGEMLPGASVYSSETGLGAITNAYGFYSLTLPIGKHTINCAYLGFKPYSSVIELTKNTRLNPELSSQTHNLSEVKINGLSKVDQRGLPYMGLEKLDVSELRKMPVLFGETDPLKTIQLLPGISPTSEGSTSLSVRGGNPDQNLLQFDEAIVYNGGHLLGFFSIFNNDAIKEVQVYKGDLPAWTGGRLSSLIDIRSRDGNINKISGIAGIGLISSKVTIEGPIKKGISSFLISGRRSYLDMFLPFSSEKEIRDYRLYFYDTNIKLNYIAGENDRLFLSSYYGRDALKNNMARLDFGNRMISLRWNHLFSQKLFSNATLVSSRYDYYLESIGEALESIQWDSRLNDYSFKYAFSYYPEAGDLVEFGIQSIYHSINPGHITSPEENSSIREIKIPIANSFEHALYISHTKHLVQSVTLRYGLRYSLFQNIGKGQVFKFDEDFEPVDTINYSSAKVFNHYSGLEPRIGLSYKLSPVFTLKASYSNTRQYLHLASNSNSATPLDIWFASSPNIKPQISNQFSLGLTFAEPKEIWEHSIELFWKKNTNTIDFKEHPDLLLNEALEGEIRTGRAFSRGIEWLTKYTQTKLNGWIAYTLSRSERQSKWINNGEKYLSPYDHTHDLSIVINYVINPKIQLTGNWVYFTGTPVTLPIGRFDFQEGVIPIYSKRNAERMPDYHRMDVALTIQGKNRASRSWKSEWNISVYNLYGRKNTWMIGFTGDDDIDPYLKKAEKTYLFSIVPSVSYVIRF